MKRAVSLCVVCLGLSGCVTAPHQPGPDLVMVDEKRLIKLASAAVVRKFPDIRLSDYVFGQIICIRYPALTPAFVDAVKGSEFTVSESVLLAPPPLKGRERIFVDWLGTIPLEVEAGDTPASDRKRVQKIRVELAEDGKTVSVKERSTWLERAVPNRSNPDLVREEMLR